MVKAAAIRKWAEEGRVASMEEADGVVKAAAVCQRADERAVGQRADERAVKDMNTEQAGLQLNRSPTTGVSGGEAATGSTPGARKLRVVAPPFVPGLGWAPLA